MTSWGTSSSNCTSGMCMDWDSIDLSAPLDLGGQVIWVHDDPEYGYFNPLVDNGIEYELKTISVLDKEVEREKWITI